jgi:hypothetical protein
MTLLGFSVKVAFEESGAFRVSALPDGIQVPEDFDAELCRLCLGAAIRRVVPPRAG